MGMHQQSPYHAGKVRALFAAVFFLAALLSACGSDNPDRDIQIVSATAEYHNTDQPARLVANFSIPAHIDPPLPLIHQIVDENDLVAYGDEIEVDLAQLEEFDFETRDYFVVVEISPCAYLVRREAFVKSNLFIYEAEYEFGDLVCPAVVSFEGHLFDLAKAP